MVVVDCLYIIFVLRYLQRLSETYATRNQVEVHIYEYEYKYIEIDKS